MTEGEDVDDQAKAAVKALSAITKAMNDRTKWPAMVFCRRTANPFGGFCTGHADCRAEYWRRYEDEQQRLAARGTAPRPKSRAVLS